MVSDCTKNDVCENPHPNAPYGLCNISRVARCVTHSNKANTVLSVWKLHCAGWKIHSLTKSKISPVCVDRFSLFFHQLKARSYAWDCYKIWFASLTDLWESQRFLHAQCLLGHPVYASKWDQLVMMTFGVVARYRVVKLCNWIKPKSSQDALIHHSSHFLHTHYGFLSVFPRNYMMNIILIFQSHSWVHIEHTGSRDYNKIEHAPV